MKVKIKAKAKINLSLNIVGEKEGYHLLDSVVTEIGLGDILYVESSDKISVTYDNGFCVEEEKDNTIKTIKAFMQEFNVGAVKVFVKKRCIYLLFACIGSILGRLEITAKRGVLFMSGNIINTYSKCYLHYLKHLFHTDVFTFCSQSGEMRSC